MPGPGTELKLMFSRIGIHSTPECKCEERAALMDEQGPDWCAQNIDLVVGWLEEEASARGVPFMRSAGRVLVKLAIRSARRSMAS